LLTRLLSRGQGDLIADFSIPLTNRVIAKLMGVPQDQSDWMADQAEAILTSDMPVTNRTPRGFGYAAAFPEFTAFIDALIAARKAEDWQGGDAITRIIAAAGGATVAPPDTIIRMVLTQLLLGGSATTRDFLGSLFLELIRKPGLHRAIAADPALVAVAVEEGLRLAPPVLFVIRTCREATEFGDVTIQPGERVVAATSAANRDAAIFPDPDTFRLDRDHPAPHLSFGYGAHFCVGGALARMEIEIALERFIKLVEPSQLKTADDFTVRYMPTPFLFGPASLPVTSA
jgi:cytochrome P450